MKVTVSSGYFDKSLDKHITVSDIIEVDDAKIERLKAIGIECVKVKEDEKASDENENDEVKEDEKASKKRAR